MNYVVTSANLRRALQALTTDLDWQNKLFIETE